MDIVGFGIVIFIYIIIVAIGILAARTKTVITPKDFIVAGQNLGLCIGIATLVATEVGGAFVNATAEQAYLRGFLWCLAPIGYSISMTINGLFFVSKIREKNYITLIDALQDAYGKTIGGLIYIPCCIGDICWTAAVLSTLAVTLQVMLEASKVFTIILSATFAVLYTLIGGMNSVAYTDVVQLLLTFLGLCTGLVCILVSDNVQLDQSTLQVWTGTIKPSQISSYIDEFLLIICGGIPWQPYYQRALSMRNNRQVQILSVSATIICLICMIPSVTLGVAAKYTLSQGLSYNGSDSSAILPIMIYQETPVWASYLSLAAISAAVMSSVDSALLSGASYISHNLIHQTFQRNYADDDQSSLTKMRVSIVALALISTCLSFTTSTIYGLWVLAADLGYVIVFPQFVAAVHFPNQVNGIGSVVAALVAAVLRILIGESIIGLPAVIPVSRFDSVLPIKTIIMLTSLLALVLASRLSKIATHQYINFRHRV